MSTASAQPPAKVAAGSRRRTAAPPPVPPPYFLRARSPLVRGVARNTVGLALCGLIRTWERIGRFPHLHRLFMRCSDSLKGLGGGGFGEYEPTARDVLVVTFPKSGTNLTLQILQQIAHGGRSEFRHIHDVCPWPDSFALGTASLGEDPGDGLFRVIKTHLPVSQLPVPEEPGPAKWVYVARDPRDVFVSAYHFYRGIAFGRAMPSVEEWLGTFLRNEYHFGSWAEHVAGFWALRHRPDVLFLTFRELTRDPGAAVDRLAAFVGADLTAQERAEVLRLSSRDWMKAHDERFRPNIASLWADLEAPMVRRGVSGGSGELLTPDQQRRIAEFCKAELRRLGCDLCFDETFGPATVPQRSAPPRAAAA
ncbi:sulfotransferase domain-containing protein [Alienimonas sp. DA493]|uniref:sulfotransferase domain-containing protein n=1 Tax=Alienimonas sp. DA493 TaxID=3373605 RepID=UPI003754F54C